MFPESVKSRLLIIDNYDSFAYNLVQYLSELGHKPEVVRNDAVSIEEVARMASIGIVISPGPCTPKEAGISTGVVRRLGAQVPILGVCLGHQCIGEAYGGRVVRAGKAVHGKSSLIRHQQGIYCTFPLRCALLATIPWSSIELCLLISTRLRGPRMAFSWESVTATIPWKECSFTPSPS